MKKLTKKLSLLLAVVALTVTGCKKGNENAIPSSKGNTYVGIALDFSNAQLRATSEVNTHNKGEWSGKDKISSMTVYLVNESTNQITNTDFTSADFGQLTSEGKLFPKKAIEATANEQVKVYVVINDFSQKLTSALNAITNDVAAFEAKFDEAVVAKAADVSKSESDKDVILMTNDVKPTAITIKPNITKQQAITGPGEAQNHIVVKVSRVVSRGIVTYIAAAKDQGIVVKTAAGTPVEDSKVSIETITYSLGQGNAKFFPIAPAADKLMTPKDLYGYIPSTSDFSTKLPLLMDFEGVKTFTDVKAIEANSSEKLIPILKANDGRYLLPVTHADGNYRKGNTSYADIKVTFKPAKVDDVAPKSVATVYLGLTDGKFYSTRAKAEAQDKDYSKTTGNDHAQAADVKQQAVQYKDGVMHYLVWLNPDNIPGSSSSDKTSKSPTVRNQVYNIIIKGFKEIGIPNNPLNPEDPSDPNDPENPIKPDDPLETNKTYLSTEIQVMAWTLNGYEIDLGNDY